MPTYGDLFFQLKNDQIFPRAYTYDILENWFRSNVDHNENIENAKCTKLSWLKTFFADFKRESKRIWDMSKKKVYAGRNDSVDFYLKRGQ